MSMEVKRIRELVNQDIIKVHDKEKGFTIRGDFIDTWSF